MAEQHPPLLRSARLNAPLLALARQAARSALSLTNKTLAVETG
jgi:hypothetical protein